MTGADKSIRKKGILNKIGFIYSYKRKNIAKKRI